MSASKKREKCNVQEFEPPEKQIIERMHCQKELKIDIKNITILNSCDFKNIVFDYIYELNFPKDSKLQEIKCISTPNLQSIALPSSLTTIGPRSFKKCNFLQQIEFLKNDSNENNLSYVGDHAFDRTIIQSIILPEKIKEIGSFCFPHTLKEIDFEKGAPYLVKINDNAFNNTQIEVFKMPLNIAPFIHSNNIFSNCKNLKTIIFDHYVNKEKPISMKEEEECLHYNNMFCLLSIEKIELFSSNISNFLFYNTPKLNDITIPKSDNSKYLKQDGCLYTKDKKKLIVAERNTISAKIFKECQIISNYAFNIKCFEKVLFEENSNLQKISFFAFYDSKIKEINIPDSVTDIEECSFLDCKNLEVANIPLSLNLLKPAIFYGTKLREITIHKNVTNISSYCFFNCHQLKKVSIEKDSNLSKIEDFTFSNTKIESFSIPKNVKTIGNYCFSNCHELKTIEFDDSNSDITNLGIGCFKDTQIETFQLPQKIRKFDFSLTNAKIICFNDFCSISSISNFKLSKIEQISIPSSVKEIGPHAFRDCVNLKEVKIIDFENSKLEKICDHSFTNCINLTVFEIPVKVKYFGLCSFKNTKNYVKQIKLFNDDNDIIICESAFEKSGIVSFESKSQSIKIGSFAFRECKKLTDFSVMTNKECIFGSSVFIDCDCLKNVKLSPSTEVIEFGENCFMNSAIQKFEVPQQLKQIPKSCFKNCENLSEFVIHEASEIIEFSSEAFLNSNIQAILIPSKTKLIERLCFSDCKSLKAVTFSNDLQDCCICEKAFYQSGVEQLDIPGGIIKIERGCFENCEKLKQVNFSDNTKVTEIKYKAFKSSGIENLILPSSISKIENSAFENCKQLKTVNFLCDQVSISPYAFANCSSLEEVKYDLLLSIELLINNQFPTFEKMTIKFDYDEIEKELIEPLFVSREPLFQLYQKVPFYSFYYLINKKWIHNKALCDKLTSLIDIDKYYIFEKRNNEYYAKNRRELVACDFFTESLNIPKETEIIHLSAFKYTLLKKIDFETNSNLQIIDNHAFENTQIEEISLPDTLKIIGNWAFDHCNLLKKVKINSKSELKTIGKYAFSNTPIESILFPLKLTRVDSYAFHECFKLNTVENHSNEIKFKYGCFSYSSIENIQFPQYSTFSFNSFKGCYKLRHLKFLEDEPNKIKFKAFSFTCSAIEEIDIKCEVEIELNAFSNCQSLKKVILHGPDNKFMKRSFSNSNNIEFISFEKRIAISKEKEDDDPLHFQYMIDILKTNIKKASLKLHFYSELTQEDVFVHDFYLDNYCYVVNNKLVYADMLNYDLLPIEEENDNEIEIKKNEAIHVPNNVKKLCFPAVRFIKNINWGTNCIVDDLGPSGFFSYYNLTQITIPKLIKAIPSKMFQHCHYLNCVYFEKESILEEICDFSFANTRISKIVFPKTLRRIGKNAFCDDQYLKEVVFDGEIIDDGAFSNTGITSFKLSNNTTTIGSNAFEYCHLLTKFDIDIQNSKLSQIGKHAFQETSINEINIPSKIKVIEKFTFNGCKDLKEVFISNESELKSIESHSFSGNLSLEKINLPKAITKLSYNAFVNTPSLQSIMNESTQLFNVTENKTVYKKDWSLIFVPRNLEKFELIKNCSKIHCGSFCGPKLKEVVFPADSSLTIIGKLSFAHCTGLKEIRIPNSVEKLGNECFIGCQSLEKVEFEPQSKIKEIPQYCFAYSGLKFIQLPESIIKINHSSFLLCQNLQNIDLFNSKINYIDHCAFSGTNLDELKFPSSLEFIGNNAFGGRHQINEIDFSEFDEIKDEAFNSRNQYNTLLLKKYFTNECKLLNDSENIENQDKNSNNDMPEYQDENSGQNRDVPEYQDENSDQNRDVPEYQDENSDVEETAAVETSSESNSFCFVHQNAFCDASVKCFKFNLPHYQWFSFFEKCSNIERYIVNNSTELVLQQSSTKCMYDYLAGLYYKISKLKMENQEDIPFLYEQAITEFTIPKTAKCLFSYHFSCCFELTTINFEEGISIKRIPYSCFSNTPLKKITIPSSVTVIDESAFFCCIELEEVNFANDSQLKIIKSNAFCKCKKLTKIDFPKNLEKISMNCFSFTGLTRVEIPSSVKTIERMTFFNCKQLSQIVLNDKLEKIMDLSFAYNNSLQSIELPDSLRVINSRAFFRCTNLKSVKTTEKTQLIEIHDLAFERTQIEEISVNKNATKLFDPINMPNFKKITFYDGKPSNFIQLDDGTIYEKNIKFTNIMKIDVTELEDNVNKNLLAEVLKSNSYCSKNYNQLKKMDYNDLNKCYSKDAFKIMIQKNRSRFSTKEELIQNPIIRLLFIPKDLNVLRIKEDCFSVSESVIQNFQNITTIEYENSSTNYVFNLFSINYHTMQKLTTIKILGDYIYMNKNCFSHLESLETVEFGAKTEVLLIPKGAFYGCKKLQRIRIPSSCVSIEEAAFKDCTSLSSIEFSSNVKYIRKESFYNCISLESIEIPSSVLIICESAFMNCANLQKVEFKMNDENSLEFIGKNCFRNCTSLVSLNIPKTCMIIGPSSFMNCTKLEKFEYEGENLKSIQCRTFFNCSSLKSVTIKNLAYSNNYYRPKPKPLFSYYRSKDKKGEDEDNNDYNDDIIKNYSKYEFFSIEAEAFMNCFSLTNVIIEDKSKQIGTIKFDKNHEPRLLKPILYRFKNFVGFNEKGNARKKNLFNLCQTIQKRAFYNCKSLQSVRLFLGNFECFNREAFGNCTSLKTIEMNSQYFTYVFSEGFIPTAFSDTPDDLTVNLFDHEECIKSIKIKSLIKNSNKNIK